MQPTVTDLKALVSTGKTQRIPVDGQPCLYVQITGKPGSPVLSWVFRYRVGKQQVNYTLGRWPELSWPEVKRRMIDLRQQAKSGVRISPPRLTRRNRLEALTATAAKASALATAAEKVGELLEIKGRRQAIAMALGETPGPPVAPPDTTKTVKEIAETWYTDHVLARNAATTAAYQRWALDRHVLPALAGLKVTELTTDEVFALLDHLAHIPVTANRVKALISKMFNWSKPRNKVMATMSNPTEGWDRHPEESRDRRLSEAEIIALGKAYAKAPTGLTRAAIFCLLTGCREGAVLALTPDTKLDDGLLRFDKGHPGLKGCRAIYVPPTAADLLDKIETPVLKRSLWRSWSALRTQAGLGDVSIHDLRRTFASVGVDRGHDAAVIDVLLGHSQGKIKDTYLIRSDQTLALAAFGVSEYIASLLGIALPKPKTKAKVIQRQKG